jgi:hypothetical protein
MFNAHHDFPVDDQATMVAALIKKHSAALDAFVDVLIVNDYRYLVGRYTWRLFGQPERSQVIQKIKTFFALAESDGDERFEMEVRVLLERIPLQRQTLWELLMRAVNIGCLSDHTGFLIADQSMMLAALIKKHSAVLDILFSYLMTSKYTFLLERYTWEPYIEPTPEPYQLMQTVKTFFSVLQEDIGDSLEVEVQLLLEQCIPLQRRSLWDALLKTLNAPNSGWSQDNN